MEELVYKLDNTTIVKLLGGLAAILLAVLTLFAKIFQTRLQQWGELRNSKQIESLKGNISKNSSLLNSIAEDYFAHSQKLADKKIQGYELLWSLVQNVKKQFPPAITLVHVIFSDRWFESSSAVSDLQRNAKLNKLLNSYDGEPEALKIIESTESLTAFRPFLTDKSFKLFYTYRALAGRVTIEFLKDFKENKIYYWKADSHIAPLLEIVLTDKEIKYLETTSNSSLPALFDLLEYKILQDLRANLNIKETTADTIQHLKDIERILSVTKNN